MRKILALLFLTFALSAGAQDYRSTSTATVSGLVGFMDIAASPAAVTTSGASARTATDVAAFSTVRIYCTIETYVNFGTSSVTATTSNPRIAAGLPEVFSMGNNVRVAFITGGSAGSCDVTVLR